MPEVVLLRISPGGDYDEETAEVAAQLLAAVRGLGYDAAVDEEAVRWPGSGLSWSLALRWVGDYGGEVAALGGFLLLLGEKVRAIFHSRRRPLPRYLELYGPDNEVISRVQLSDDDDA
jgi:hypothetical protein